MVELGVSPNLCDDCGWTPIHRAIVNDHKHVVLRLIDLDADVDVADGDGWRAIHNSSLNGDIELVEKLLSCGADANQPTQDGRCAIHYASRTGKLDVLDALIGANVELNVADQDGLTPVHLAGASCEKGSLEKLVAAGADIDAKSNNGFSCVHHACEWMRPTAVQFILKLGELGANMNQRDQYDRCPIHMIAGGPRIDILTALLDAKADVNAADGNGVLPINYASQTDMWQLMIDRGAQQPPIPPDSTPVPSHTGTSSNNFPSS